MHAVSWSFFLCWLALSAVQLPNGAASDLANTALLLNHAPEANGPLLLEVTEHSDLPHEFPGLAKTYGVTITNMTHSAVSIEREILIERKAPKGWNPAGAIQALVNCSHYEQGYDFKSPASIAARSSLAVYPWNGQGCGGQCSEACLQNTLARPGIYRFVAVLLPEGTRIASPPFLVSGP
jgi:hypothetical protein